jgi:hypothetical protein
LARELLALRPDLVLARATPAVSAILNESRTVPIVFTQIADPIGVGFVASLARPGGNLTGFTNYEASVAGKWLDMLKEIAPDIKRVAFMFNPVTAPYSGIFLRVMEVAAPKFAVELTPTPVHDDGEIEAALSALARAPGGGLVVGPDAFLTSHRKPILESAARYRLPAVYPNLSFATDGGLIAYAVDTKDIYRRAALYVDPRHPARGAGGLHRREVDARLLRHAARERRGPRLARLRRRRRRRGCARPHRRLAARVDRGEGRAHRRRLALRHQDALDHPSRGRRDLGVDLVGRDLEQRLIARDFFAHTLQPACHGAFGDGLTHLRHGDFDSRHFQLQAVCRSVGSPR